MTILAGRFPAYAALTDDQLLELAEETAVALAEAARGAHDAGRARVAAVAARLGIADEFDALADYLLARNEGTR